MRRIPTWPICTCSIIRRECSTRAKGLQDQVRVVIGSAEEVDVWSTVGVSETLIEPSWPALVDSVEDEFELGPEGIPRLTLTASFA